MDSNYASGRSHTSSNKILTTCTSQREQATSRMNRIFSTKRSKMMKASPHLDRENDRCWGNALSNQKVEEPQTSSLFTALSATSSTVVSSLSESTAMLQEDQHFEDDSGAGTKFDTKLFGADPNRDCS
jgi:hypothetical protein